MTEREMTRISQYCKRLNLNRFDTRDIINYFSTKLYKTIGMPRGESMSMGNEHIKAYQKIKQLGIFNMVMGFEAFLMAEEKLFAEYKSKNKDSRDEDIWSAVYEEINKEVDLETERAKRATSSSGCSGVFLFVFIAFLFVSLIF